MFNVGNFRFLLVPDDETRCIYFIIAHTVNGDSTQALTFDTVDAWVAFVSDELKKGKTSDEIVREFRNGTWDDLEDSFRSYWSKLGYTVDEVGYRVATELYFSALKSLADGVVWDNANKIQIGE